MEFKRLWMTYNTDHKTSPQGSIFSVSPLDEKNTVKCEKELKT